MCVGLFFIFKLLKQYRFKIMCYLAAGTILYLITSIISLIVGGFIDAFADSIDIANVLKLCLIFHVLSMVQVVLRYYVKVEGTKIEELGERYGLSLILINVAEKSEFGAGLDIYMGNFK